MRFATIALGLALMGLHVQATYGQAPAATRVGPPLSGQPSLRIGVIADAQFSDIDASIGRYYRISLEKLHAAVDTFNAQGVDLVINVGDLIDQRLESYPVVLREIARLQMPVHHLLGNHEFWDVPFHLQKSVLDSLGLAAPYCELELDGWRMLMLDGTELAEYAQGAHPEVELEGRLCRESLAGHTNGAVWNGAIGTEQMEWMEGQLQAAEAMHQKVALFCHFPISPAGHPMTLWNESDLRGMLARYPQAKAWFAGHSHSGGYHFLQGLHHLTFGGMLMTADSNAFAILDFFPDQIVVEGFGREPYRVMPLGVGSIAATSIFPDTLPPPDAVPEPIYPCVHRQVKDAFGKTLLIDEVGGLEPATLPKLRPGCYDLTESSDGKVTHRPLIVLPKSR